MIPSIFHWFQCNSSRRILLKCEINAQNDLILMSLPCLFTTSIPYFHNITNFIMHIYQVLCIGLESVSYHKKETRNVLSIIYMYKQQTTLNSKLIECLSSPYQVEYAFKLGMFIDIVRRLIPLNTCSSFDFQINFAAVTRKQRIPSGIKPGTEEP